MKTPGRSNFFADKGGTTRGITRKLKAACDTPIWVDEEIWTLHASTLSHGNLSQFHIQKRGNW
jgi:hypothetical protein